MNIGIIKFCRDHWLGVLVVATLMPATASVGWVWLVSIDAPVADYVAIPWLLSGPGLWVLALCLSQGNRDFRDCAGVLSLGLMILLGWAGLVWGARIFEVTLLQV